MDKQIIYGIDISRVSDPRNLGDSHQRQEEQTDLAQQRIEAQYNCKIEIVHAFHIEASATKEYELQPILDALDWVKEWNNHNPNKQIKYAFFKSIDRITRGGSVIYGQLKANFASLGVSVVDAFGQINTQSFNTLEYLGVEEYSWSIYQPSFSNELMAAEAAKDYVRQALTNMIGAEIKYIRKGYSVGPAHVGMKNLKVDTSFDGRRCVEVPDVDSKHTKWFTDMYNLSASGNYTDEEIVRILNKDGFLTPVLKLHDPVDHNHVIGYKGGIPLDVEQMRVYRENPIYAGINREKWTAAENHGRSRDEYKAIKLHPPGFPGLVTIEHWNRTNKGRWEIIENDEEVFVIKGGGYKPQPRRDDVEKVFPWKFILCPFCKQPLNSSFTTKPNGSKFGAYHCHSSHRQDKYGKHYFRTPLSKMDGTITKFIRKLKFKEDKILYWKKYYIEEWNLMLIRAKEHSRSSQEKVEEFETQQIMLRKQLSWATTKEGFNSIEKQLNDLAVSKAKALNTREEKELRALDIELVLNVCGYFFQNIEDLILGDKNPLKRGALLKILFKEIPTYDQLKARKVQLEDCVELVNSLKVRKSNASEPAGDRTQDQEIKSLLLYR